MTGLFDLELIPLRLHTEDGHGSPAGDVRDLESDKLRERLLIRESTVSY